jgi:hypothetical protein
MTIGATVGDEPDYVEDGDLKTVEELRGAYQDMHKAKLSLNEKATVEGVLAEIQVVKQQIKMQSEQMNRLIGMYGTLQRQFDQYNAQRVKELNVRVNGGSTTPEDLDGTQP